MSCSDDDERQEKTGNEGDKDEKKRNQEFMKSGNDVVNSVSVKLQPFWANSPAVWFIQAEAQFAIAKIKKDVTKYNYVLGALPQNVLETVIDFIQSPPALNIYDKFKETLIQRHSLSEERRIEKLLSSEQLGDRKPSEFLRALKQLAGSSSGIISDDLIRKLWLRRLPQVINIALIAQETKPEAEVTSLADKIWEASSVVGGISEVNSNNKQTSSASTTQTELRSEINELKCMVEQLTSRLSRQNFRSQRNSNRNNSRSRHRSRSRSGICWFHSKFGSNARNCATPCNFNKCSTSSKTNVNEKN